MLISVFLVWETTLIKFKSSFSSKARNNLPIIDRIIKDTHFLFTFIDFSSKFERKKLQTFPFFRRTFKIRACSGDPWDSVIVFPDNSCYAGKQCEGNQMQSAVNKCYYHSMQFFLPFHWPTAHHVTCK